jgi:hypothetical protein
MESGVVKNVPGQIIGKFPVVFPEKILLRNTNVMLEVKLLSPRFLVNVPV